MIKLIEMQRGLWLAFVLIFMAPLHAQVELSFPLDGFYRPGKYMPVQFRVRDVSFDPGLVFLSAPGAVPTRILLKNGQAEGIAPMLTVDPALGELDWRLRPDVPGLEGLRRTGPWDGASGKMPTVFQPLLGDQRLVGLLNPADLAVARKLLPGHGVIPIQLDPASPLPGPAVAWEALDALILDVSTFTRIEAAKRTALLAGGMLIAVRAEHPPDTQWPWRKEGELFVLKHGVAGPRVSGEYAAAFAPVQGWSAGWPDTIRRRALIYAVMTSIALLGISLLRWRWMVTGCIVAAAIATALLRWWWKQHPVVLEKTGQVLVTDHRVAQSDTWSWQSSGQTTLAITPWVEMLRPVFQQAEDRRESLLCLQCWQDGMPQMFLYRARRGLILAFMSRSVGLRWPEVRDGTQDGPMSMLAKRIYLGPDDQIAGTIEAPISMNSRKTVSERWEPVVVERK